ncbi:AHH domain-containing protein [Qipengyuania sp. ASV99]|uniref:AHH domain-containing protein n=1 Tax=Qipengyuania sp. ASV99 TaxID=3399681 RepID=UPI003A4C81BC
MHKGRVRISFPETNRWSSNHAARRRLIPFRSVNRCGTPGFDKGLQRHHILPRQLLSKHCFGLMFEKIGRASVGFDDFRANGLLLPATDEASLRTGMPLHRGPHRQYNELVLERVGRIEEHWSATQGKDTETAMREALERLTLLQSALRKRLLSDRRRMVLNRKDPLGTGFDFSELDAMAELLWEATQEPIPPPPP